MPGDAEEFKQMVLDYVNLNSPVVGLRFLAEISSMVPYFSRGNILNELVKAGEIIELDLSGHMQNRYIYIRKNTRIEIPDAHVSVKNGFGYHRIGHGTEK